MSERYFIAMVDQNDRFIHSGRLVNTEGEYTNLKEARKRLRQSLGGYGVIVKIVENHQNE